MLDLLSQGLQRKVTLMEVAAATRISRQTLSRIINEPEVPTTSDFIDSIILFFFGEFRDFLRKNPIVDSIESQHFTATMDWSHDEYERFAKSEKRLMNWIVSEAIQVFPGDESYTNIVKESVRGSLYGVVFSLLWSVYEKQSVIRS